MKRQWIQYERKKELSLPYLFDDPRYVAGVIILALGAFCVFQAWYLLFHSSYFTLQDVVLKGSKNIELNKVLEIGELVKGQRTFGMDFREISSKIEQNPRIKSASILQISPNSLQITIQERPEWIQIWGQSSILGLSVEGFFFPIEKPDVHPRVRLKIEDQEWKGSRLELDKLELLTRWQSILEASSLSNYDLLSLEDLSSVFITVNGTPIYIEDYERFAEHEGKIHLMLKEVLQTGKTIEYIDARFEDMVVKIS